MRTADILHDTKDRPVLRALREAARNPGAQTKPLWRTLCHRWLEPTTVEQPGLERDGHIYGAEAV